MLHAGEDCKTKYPILLVHGTGFRDRKRLSYWGRIPKSLEERGTTLYYGGQDSWGNIEENAATVKANLSKILLETGCEKVNIIAHSKGGLEARYMVSSLAMANSVASITTIASPHHGSKTIDWLLKFPDVFFKITAVFINLWCRICGDKNSDFYHACRQFSTQHMEAFNEKNPDVEGVYYQSYGAAMKNPFSDILFFFPNLIVGHFEGENDGLVTPTSATWTSFRGVLRGATRRGISHGDEVDMRRMRLSRKSCPGAVSDIREVYIDIVSGLRDRGL